MLYERCHEKGRDTGVGHYLLLIYPNILATTLTVRIIRKVKYI